MTNKKVYLLQADYGSYDSARTETLGIYASEKLAKEQEALYLAMIEEDLKFELPSDEDWDDSTQTREYMKYKVQEFNNTIITEFNLNE